MFSLTTHKIEISNSNKIGPYIISSVVYKTMLDIVYRFGTSVIYSYLGRVLCFNAYKYIIGWITYLLFVYFICKLAKDAQIRFMIKTIFMLSGTSNFSVYGMRSTDNLSFVYVCIFWSTLLIFCFIVPKINLIKNHDKKKAVSISTNIKNEIFLVIGVLITVFEVAKFGINVSDFNSLYSARDTFRSQSLSTIDSYLLSWNGTVILPWCFLQFYREKRYLYSGVALLSGIIMFLINGLKTWIVMYFIVIGFAILFKFKKMNYDRAINTVLIGLGTIGIGITLLWC